MNRNLELGKHVRSILIAVLIFILLIFVVDKVLWTNAAPGHLKTSELYAAIDGGKVKSVTISGHDVTGEFKEAPANANGDVHFVSTIGDADSDFRKELSSHHVEFNVEQTAQQPVLGTILQLVPFAIMALFLIFILRQAQSGGSQALSFGRSRAKLLSENRPKVTFADVAGIEEAKEELGEVVEFLKFPKKFQALGARIPKGVLLLGPPGSGKTLLARAIAGEAGVPFFSISGSDFVEMFVGVGASRVRDLFEQAKKIIALYRVHRRDRCGRPAARCRTRRRP